MSFSKSFFTSHKTSLTNLLSKTKKYLLTNKKLHEFCLSQSTVHSEGGACTKGGPGHPGTGECANRWRGGRKWEGARQRGRAPAGEGGHASAISAQMRRRMAEVGSVAEMREDAKGVEPGGARIRGCERRSYANEAVGGVGQTTGHVLTRRGGKRGGRGVKGGGRDGSCNERGAVGCANGGETQTEERGKREQGRRAKGSE